MKDLLIIDPQKFKKALKRRGFKSLSHLAKASGVHRNTITEYLSMRSSPFQTTFIKLTETLHANPFDLLANNEQHQTSKALTIVEEITQEFVQQYPGLCIALINFKEDIEHHSAHLTLGFSRGANKLGQAEFSICKVKLEEMLARRRIKVDCYNLDRASQAFLRDLPETYRFLDGDEDSFRFVNGFIAGIKSFVEQPKTVEFSRGVY